MTDVRSDVRPRSAPDPELAVRIDAIDVIAEGVVSLTLVRPDGGPFPAWEPGAHVDLLLAPGLERQYSLHGDPADRAVLQVAVLREPDSRGGSEWVHTRLSAGQSLTIRGPRNNFPLVAAAHYVLIAGGIGITPILAMARELERTGRSWRLVYGGRTSASMAFLDELARYGDRVLVWPQDTNGHIALDDLLGTPHAGTAVYCCGPEPLLAAVEERCAAWPPGALHLERFQPKAGALDGERRPFDVACDHSGVTVHVAADTTIAEALGAAGIDVPTSCREGTCGTCETVVLEGIPDHRDSYLTAEERASNEVMMVCCSRACGDRLVLDL